MRKPIKRHPANPKFIIVDKEKKIVYELAGHAPCNCLSPRDKLNYEIYKINGGCRECYKAMLDITGTFSIIDFLLDILKIMRGTSDSENQVKSKWGK